MTQSGLLGDGVSTALPVEAAVVGKNSSDEKSSNLQAAIRSIGIEDIPMAIWCCDWSRARQMMDQLGAGGLGTLRSKLRFESFLHLAASSTQVIDANEAARGLGEILGTSPGAGWLSRLSNGDFLRWFAACLASLHSGDLVSEGQVCIRTADAHPRRFLMRARPMEGMREWSAVVVCVIAVTTPDVPVDRADFVATKPSPYLTSDAVVASISHEVKQPIGAIQNYAAAAKRWLHRDAMDLEEARRCVDRVIAQATRSAAIIRGLETLSRCRMTDCQRVLASDLMSDAVALLRMEELADGSNIVMNLPPSDLVILGDVVQLRQVLLNLMRNAIQAMADSGSDGCVRVMAHEENGHVVIGVRDEGPGIAESESELIFMPFHGRRKGGSGMGLAICRAIVHAHSGDIDVRNHEAGGAEFRIRVPLDRHPDAGMAL
jgi:nitrogen-specific signal transduction histidine kinase